MKKLSVIIAIIAALAVIGCASSGGGGGGSDAPPYSVDLSAFPLVKNTEPLTQDWEDFLITPVFDKDVSAYSRVTIRTKFYRADGSEITQADGQVMVSFILDLEGDWRGPAMGPGPNTPLKEFNVGGFSSLLHGDKGIRVRLSRNPGGILFQRNPASPVAFIELTELVFHNSTASGQ